MVHLLFEKLLIHTQSSCILIVNSILLVIIQLLTVLQFLSLSNQNRVLKHSIACIDAVHDIG